MGYDLWEEGELMSLAKQSLLAKLASTLDIDLSRWLESAISVLPETLRVTKARSDQDWTVNELRKMGGKPSHGCRMKALGKCRLPEARQPMIMPKE